eukprot:1160571-Pelagomonas_calceolata.AAC.6
MSRCLGAQGVGEERKNALVCQEACAFLASAQFAQSLMRHTFFEGTCLCVQPPQRVCKQNSTYLWRSMRASQYPSIKICKLHDGITGCGQGSILYLGCA